MGSTKAAPAKAGTSAAQAHRRRATSLLQTPTKAPAAMTSTPSPRKKKTRPAEDPENWNFTHNPATREERAKNGRHEGRNLVTWTRPRMAEKLLLHIQYECSRHKIDLPWDNIAHRLHPGSSGSAVQQHLNRLRHQLISEGHLVPPICQKPGSRVTVDQNIRGYIRKFPDSDDTTTTRAVTWAEPLDDRKFNLADAADQPDMPVGTKSQDTGGSAQQPNVKQESPDRVSLEQSVEYIPDPKKVTKQTLGRPSRPSRAAKAKAVSYTDYDDNDAFDELTSEDDGIKHTTGIADEHSDLGDEDYENITVITPTRTHHRHGYSTAGAKPAAAYTCSARAFEDDMYRVPAQRSQDDLFGSQLGAAQGREQPGHMAAASQMSYITYEDYMGLGNDYDNEEDDGISWGVWPPV